MDYAQIDDLGIMFDTDITGRRASSCPVLFYVLRSEF